jgi:hypothetical protein
MKGTPKMVSESQSPEVKYALGKMENLPWYKNSSVKVKTELASLGDKFLEYLIRLSKKNPVDREIIEIKSICHSENLVITTFRTRSKQTNQDFVEEEVGLSEKDNNKSYGVLLLGNSEGEVANLIFLKNGPIQMYYPDFSAGKTVVLPEKTEKLLKNSLGIDKVVIKKYIDLGKVTSGLAFIDSEINLFAAVLETENVKMVNSNEIRVLGADNLINEVSNINNALLLAIIEKLRAVKIIK